MLIGPNGSGKSNIILDVLRLVRQLVVDGMPAEDALGSRGGYQEAVWGSIVENDIEVELKWRPDGDANETATYRMQLRFEKPDRVRFESEDLIGSGESSLSRTTPTTVMVQRESSSFDLDVEVRRSVVYEAAVRPAIGP